MIIKKKNRDNKKTGFSLVEVTLAIGVLGLAVLALLGMFAPTLNNINSVIESDFAISASGHITNYLERQAADNFNDMIGLASSSTADKAGNTMFYAYMRSKGGQEELFVTSNAAEVETDLSNDELLGVVLRAQLYQVPASNNYNYSKAKDAFYIPFIIKLFSVQPNNPKGQGTYIMEFPVAVTR